MKVITARNVNQALPLGLEYLRDHGVDGPSRNGGVRVAPMPVTTHYTHPTERVLFDRERNANPFFHLYEGLWMLAGFNDVESVARYASRMRTFSDDGQVLNGAYGYRWRWWFGIDQIDWAINTLRDDPSNRRVVISMWDGAKDPGGVIEGVKDVPCNLAAHVQINPAGAVTLTVFNRSNDIIWGAYGANAVHMSMLQEYIAAALGRHVGSYWQVSDNFHAYTDLYEKLVHLADQVPDRYSVEKGQCLYSRGAVAPYPLQQVGRQQWDMELNMLLVAHSYVAVTDPFLARVAVPILQAHAAYRAVRDPDRWSTALEIIDQCQATDWHQACRQWLVDQHDIVQRAIDGGPKHV